ncbi:MAG TPA: diguanylate cyclase [Giesbergeria sp.]|nr:diguanylate cyclase [Giesbergeria sp.]
MPAVPTAPFHAAGPLAQGSLPIEEAVPGRVLPGPMVLRTVLAALLALCLAAGAAGWLMARASGHDLVQRLEAQQNDEVEVFARLLSSKIEQSQKVLRAVTAGITPDMMDLPSTLEWLLQHGLPSVQFFDTMLVARVDGEVRVHLHQGRFQRNAQVEPQVREALESTLRDGKPHVAELLQGGVDDARIVLTMPLHRSDGSLLGVVAGMLRLQSQGLLPASLALPQRADTRLLVFTKGGTIVAHSNPVRVMGQVRDEPGLAEVWAQGQGMHSDASVSGTGTTRRVPQAMVSLAGMPLAQWTVARVTDTQALTAPLQGAQRQAWGQVLMVVATLALVLVLALWWLTLPLSRLRQQAQHLVGEGGQELPSAGVVPWPRAGGEVGQLVQAFEGLLDQQATQHQHWRTVQDQLQAMLDHASVGVAVTRNGRLESVGHRLAQMLGYQPADLRGRPAGVVCTPMAREGLGLTLGGPCGLQGRIDGELCLPRKDGSTVWVQAQARPVRDDDPQAGTLWLMEETTTLRQARRLGAWAHTHDALTGLDNRQGLELRLQAMAGVAHSAPMPLEGDPPATAVLLFLDLDHFTVVNDALGHEAGDEVLRQIGLLLAAQVRKAGWIARLGGDEFAVLLPDCSEAHARSLAEQLRHAVQDWQPTVQGRSFQLEVSIGLVVLDGAVHDVPAILHAADMACYDAKRAGRNCIKRRPVLHSAVVG